MLHVLTLWAAATSSTSRRPGAAAAKAEAKKFATYNAIPSQYTFCPFAVETLGPFGDYSLKLIKDLGSRLQASSGDRRSTSFLTQRISLAFQRGNAVSILATTPTSAVFHEIFNLC